MPESPLVDGVSVDSGAIRAQHRAVAVVFAVNGATYASWLPRIPDVRNRLDVDLDVLGLALTGAGVGGLLASVAVGTIVDRIGSRRATVLAAVGLSSGLPLLGLVDSPVALGLVLVVLGLLDTVADIGMNVQAAQVDRATERSIIQRLHGLWSLGTVVGGAAGALAAATRIPVSTHFAMTAVVLVVCVLGVARHLASVDDPPEIHGAVAGGGAIAAPGSEPIASEASATAIPPAAAIQPATDAVAPSGGDRVGRVLPVLAALALCLAVLEGAPGEWAALFGRDVHLAGPGLAGVGYLALTTGMLVGRFGGDRVTDARGGPWVFRVALWVLASGVVVLVASPSQEIALMGFVLIGLGNSVLFPAVYLQAARTPGVPSGRGIGVMSVGARLGFLTSPLLVGPIGEAEGLRFALAVVLGVAVVAAAVAGRALSRAGRPTR